MDDLAVHMGVFVAPQPVYYIVVEFLKLFGSYSDLYYPQKGFIVFWILLIIVLYAPFFIQLVLFRKQLNVTSEKFDENPTTVIKRVYESINDELDDFK